jgi:hypothetical protein
MQTKMTMKYHLILVRLAIIKSQGIMSIGKNVEKRESLCAFGGVVN